MKKPSAMSVFPSTKLKGSLEHEERVGKGHVSMASGIDPAAERRLLRKLDWHLLPPLMAVFFLSFMDRTNIGTQPDLVVLTA